MIKQIRTLTIRMDKDFHKEVMKHCIDIDMSFNEYVLHLMKKDIDDYKKTIEEKENNELDIAVENFLKQFD